MTHVIVSEAYSPSNLGDRELVFRTLDYVRTHYGQEAACLLAVDSDGFRQHLWPMPVQVRLFDRLEALGAARMRRAVVALRWSLRLLSMSFLALWGCRLAASPIADRWPGLSETGRAYLRADRVVAVGGGYLGDQYVAESLLTLWTWWWLGRLGVPVETMPISIEIRSRAMSLVFRILARRVRLRCRDTASCDIVRGAGLSCDYVPDLAFLNAGKYLPKQDASPDAEFVAVALVGSDYLSPAESARLRQQLVVGLTSSVGVDVSVRVVSMHGPLGNSHVGGDEGESTALLELLAAQGIQDADHIRAQTYAELCHALSGARFLIAARMHAGIAGLCAGVPVGLLAYEDKHAALYRDMQLLDFVMPIRGTQRGVDQLIGRLIDAKPSSFAELARMMRDQVVASLGLEGAL